MQQELPLDNQPPARPKSSAAGKPAADKPGAAPKPKTPRKRTPKPPPPPPAPPPRHFLFPGVAVAVLALDQFSKWLVVQYLKLEQIREMDVLDPWLNLRMAWNEGMNFGLLASSRDTTRWLLIGIAVVVCIWVAVWVLRGAPGRLARIAAGLLVGGALGNVIDRMTYGAVADFLNMSLPNWRNPYSFNIADIAIFAGALGLVFLPQPRQATDSPPTRKAAKKAPRRKEGAKSRDGGKKTG